MTALLSEAFNTGAAGDTITTASTSFGAVAGGPVLSADSVDGLAMSAVTSTAVAKYGQHVFTATGTMYARAYVKLPAATAVMFVWNLLSGSTIRANVRINANGSLRMRNGTVAVGTDSTAVLSTTAYTRVEWMVSGSTQRLRMFTGANLHGTTPDYDSGNQTYTPATFDRLQTGCTTAVAGAGVLVDLLAADDTTWVGPAVITPPLIVDPLGLGVIGDSLSNQIGLGTGDGGAVEVSLVKSGWDAAHVRVDGEVGRPIVNTVSGTSMQTVVDTWRADGFDPATWVLANMSNNLGATDAQWTTWLGQALAKIAEGGNTYVVYIVSIGLRADIDNGTAGGVAARFLAVLKALVSPSNVTLRIVDYNAAIRAYDSVSGLWDLSDATGRHMLTAGYTQRNEIVRAAVPGPAYVVRAKVGGAFSARAVLLKVAGAFVPKPVKVKVAGRFIPALPDPTTIPDLALWVEADDYAGTGVATVVPSRVGPDMYGNTVVVTGGPGGLKAFDYDTATYGGFQYLDGNYMTFGPDVTALFVTSAAAAQNNQYADLADFNHGSGGWVIQRNDFNPGFQFAWRRGGGYVVTVEQPMVDAPTIVQVRKNGVAGSLRVANSTTTGTDTSSGMDLTYTTFRLGNFAQGNQNRGFKGRISAVVVWPRALTDAELATARGYLTARFGL